MKTVLCKNPDELRETLALFDKDKQTRSVLFLKTNDSVFAPNVIEPLVRSFSKPLIGGVFYKLIVDSKLYEEGVLLVSLPFSMQVQLFDFAADDIFEKLKQVYSGYIKDAGSVFIFTDAFTSSKSEFIEHLFNFFGFKYSFLGAGCGSEAYTSFPCIISNAGVHANAAVIGYADIQLSLGVAHGWMPVSAPLKVTEARGTKIISINWEPAFDVYREVVETHSGLTFDDSNFLEIAHSYPIGLMKMDDEMVVRDPFQVENGEIHCLDKIDAGQYIMILNGTVDSLLQGADEAGKCCKNNSTAQMENQFIFCVDCISRVKFLDGKYRQELDVIGGGIPVCGVASFGEIANVSHSFLEIYNKTVIVAKW